MNKTSNYGHRHQFPAGRLPNGSIRTCADCDERQQKIAGRWMRLVPGVPIPFGSETVVFESMSTDGRRMQIRRIRNGIPAKSTTWYEI